MFIVHQIALKFEVFPLFQGGQVDKPLVIMVIQLSIRVQPLKRIQ